MTYQTDANGQPVTKILVESCTDIAKELYLGAVVDRGSPRGLHGLYRRWWRLKKSPTKPRN